MTLASDLNSYSKIDCNTSVAVLLSGGVDSSVALRLLLESSCQKLEAFYLKIWLQEELSFLGECPWQDDLSYARAVCDAAGIKLHVIPLQQEYWDRVVSYVIEELKIGHTPSPDLLCNQRVKFGAFLESAGADFERVASGHYARLRRVPGCDTPQLLRAVDPVKDQSYFLARMSTQQLARCSFPIGDLPKPRVRELAQNWQLPNRDRKDSQGICFLGKIPYNEFVKHHLGVRKGKIVEQETGKIWGEHDGFWYHTIGQRKGLKLHGGPWYVVDKDIAENVIYISNQESVANHSCDHFEAGAGNWFESFADEADLLCKIRHGPSLLPCHVVRLDNDRWAIRLKRPDQGVAAGQFVILYDGELCLGSAVIQKTL